MAAKVLQEKCSVMVLWWKKVIGLIICVPQQSTLDPLVVSSIFSKEWEDEK
jgi:hypothetical protein